MDRQETLAWYQSRLTEILSANPSNESIAILEDLDAPSPYADYFYQGRKKLETTEKRCSPAGKSPLLILTDAVSRTGRWALAADSLGFHGIIFYASAKETFLLTFFGNGHFETIPMRLENLALPSGTPKGYFLFCTALLLTALRPELSLLCAVDQIRKSDSSGQ